MYYDKLELLSKHVASTDTVLDVGFLGQGIQKNNTRWPHALLKQRAKDVYGLDLCLGSEYKDNPHYLEASAEQFAFPVKFDVIFAGDLIEHLSNPGLFLRCCAAHLNPNGRLILTTPNTFNLFNLAEKLTKREPSVNPDHTVYFNSKVLRKLLEKNGMGAREVGFLYTLGYDHAESWKKKFLNGIYWILSQFTDKFIETVVIIATIRE